MKRAFEHFGPYQPKLSIVVCGKRHNTRFYPTTEEDAAHDGNPLPGTVVDRGITPVYEFDFFLQGSIPLFLRVRADLRIFTAYSARRPQRYHSADALFCRA